jgi:flagellar motor switch protein FliN/FliY
VREVLQLAKGSVVELDRMAGDPADLLVNGRIVARGEVTVIDDRLAVRIVEVVATREPRS